VAAAPEAHEEQVLAEGSEAEEGAPEMGAGAVPVPQEAEPGRNLPDHLIPRYGAPIDQQPAWLQREWMRRTGVVICPCTPCRTKGLGKWQERPPGPAHAHSGTGGTTARSTAGAHASRSKAALPQVRSRNSPGGGWCSVRERFSARMWPKFWRRPGSCSTRSQGETTPSTGRPGGSAKSTFTYASRATTSSSSVR